jgi:hypothetical protein
MNYEAREEGRERYRDMLPEQRAQHLSTFIKDSSTPWLDEWSKSFARGWLDMWAKFKGKDAS